MIPMTLDEVISRLIELRDSYPTRGIEVRSASPVHNWWYSMNIYGITGTPEFVRLHTDSCNPELDNPNP